MSAKHKHVGEKFGKLTVLEALYGKKDKTVDFWVCKCECGKEVRVYGRNLRSGASKSCGCFQKEAVSLANTTHGMVDLSEYRTWEGIKRRCYNKNEPGYLDYGARGITMSDEWRDSFKAFYRDMGSKPSPEHTIDRKNNNKGYSKENCRWATKKEQAENRSTSLFYIRDGVARTLKAWCEILDLNYQTVYARIKRQGMSFEEAIAKSV